MKYSIALLGLLLVVMALFAGGNAVPHRHEGGGGRGEGHGSGQGSAGAGMDAGMTVSGDVGAGGEGGAGGAGGSEHGHRRHH